MPVIRALRPGDVPALIDVFRASVRVVARRDYTHEQVMAWAPDEIDADAWARRYARRQCWVALATGELIVGFVELEGPSHLDMLYVHPAYLRCGVASALLDHVEATARELGSDRLFTEASITARPFFERRGFALIAPQWVALRNERFLNFRMAKRLADRA